MRIYLIRHGETKWNKESRYQGVKDIPLSEIGLEQVKKLGMYFSNLPLDIIVSSPLSRTKETANSIVKFYPKKLQVFYDDRFLEISHGLWEGKVVAEVKEEFKEIYNFWKVKPYEAKMPEGEGLHDVSLRATSAFKEWVNKYREKDIAFVTHDVVIRVILMDIFSLPYDFFWKFKLANAGINVLEYDEEFKLLSINLICHLNEFSAEGVI
ncbi:MAG TPA: histidine phosphatase family protein [Thermodesulfobium narugense]|uniref:Putative phosphoglycerate mutase n=1 Tax=Thermodesulfobium acidiphilum TaxID=1794699 RepID=A0A2R4VZB8_THEAF|nr:histidine phosphatase family protein [Thermodesulfobium acidiphilum]AWB09887.1 putative phosphoglycerate mutase [Thermodesulfobium acidiphilum]PMP86183.1 MAG: histidine phosphatase family protein [Thermodesulfobium narugense]HEM55343.1 histidine phosphatase family protein [Thermodesulfobium narugense]